MKIVRICAPEEIEVVEEECPAAPGAGKVRLQVLRVGLCGSDLKTYLGQNPMAALPIVPGHEIAAEIIEVGHGVPARLEAGLRVTVLPYSACGTCSACRQGRPNCCRSNRTLGVGRDGAAAESIVVPWEKVIPVGSLGLDEAALVEPLSVGWHATSRLRVRPGEKVLVFGCGLIGLGAIQAAAFQGAAVIATDIQDGKLELARGAGARHTVHSGREDLTEQVAALTNGEGVDAVIEAVGLPQTFIAAVDAACYGGRVVYVGYVQAPVCYETKLFVSKELDIMGARNALETDFAEVIRMLSTGRVDVRPLITHRYPLERAAEALRFWKEHPDQVTKILLHQGD